MNILLRIVYLLVGAASDGDSGRVPVKSGGLGENWRSPGHPGSGLEPPPKTTEPTADKENKSSWSSYINTGWWNTFAVFKKLHL